MMKLDTAFGAAHSALFLLPIVRELLIAIGGRVASRTVGETDGVSVAIFPGGGLEMTRQCPGVCTRELPARDVISASRARPYLVWILYLATISPPSRRHLVSPTRQDTVLLRRGPAELAISRGAPILPVYLMHETSAYRPLRALIRLRQAIYDATGANRHCPI